MGEAVDGEAQICRFLERVILNLAAEQNAVIFCSGLKGVCMLSDLLQRVVKMEKSVWAHRQPFKVVYFVEMLASVYCNDMKDENSTASKSREYWRTIKKESKNWNDRHDALEAIVQKKFKATNNPPLYRTDIAEDGDYYIFVEGMTDWQSSCRFVNALTSYYRKQIPTLTLKTGASKIETTWEEDLSGLSTSVQQLAASSPVIYIDARKWTDISSLREMKEDEDRREDEHRRMIENKQKEEAKKK